MKVKYQIHSLPFHHTFTISKGSKTHQPTFIVELDHFGVKGYGEAPAIAYYDIPVEKMAVDLNAKIKFVEQFAFHDPERFWHFLHHLFPKNSFLVCALDMAGWDLYGKIKRKPLYAAWGLDTTLAPVTDYTIGMDSPENMINKIKEKPWPVYKIKVGFENDVETVALLSQATSSKFRVDANAGWSLEQALKKIPQLKELGVELVEQPLAKDAWDDMRVLYKESPLPLFADESCVAEADVLICSKCFHGINIKLTKCGGITPARRMIEKAKELDLLVMLGCMNESTIGSAAIVQLSPLVHYLDVDGPLLLAEDLATGVEYNNGEIVFNTKPGLGIDVRISDF